MNLIRIGNDGDLLDAVNNIWENMDKNEKPRKASAVKKDLRTPKYKQQVVKPKKGKGSFRRKERGITDL